MFTPIDDSHRGRLLDRRPTCNIRSRGWLACARIAALVGLAAGAVACGGDEQQREPIDGPYAMILGKQNTVLRLDSETVKVTCKPQRRFKQYDFEAATAPKADAGTYVRFSLKEYKGPGKYSIEYGKALQPHTVDVGIDRGGQPKGFLYQFKVAKSGETSVPSRCQFNIEDGEQSGVVTCLLLWADRSSQDYISASNRLNRYVDLILRFDCS